MTMQSVIPFRLAEIGVNPFAVRNPENRPNFGTCFMFYQRELRSNSNQRDFQLKKAGLDGLAKERF